VPIIVALLLLVISGLVAAAGDYMGQRAARRKVRIGKLRPRYVSRLIAVISGMLISLATYGAMFFLYSDFRNALTQYNTVKQRYDEVTKQRDQADAELKSSQSKLQDANTQLASAKSDVTELENSKIQLVKDADAARQDRDQAVTERNQAQGQLAETKRLQANAEAKLKETNTRLAQANSNLSAQRGQTTHTAMQLDQFKQGDIILPYNTLLAQTLVKAGDAAQVEALVGSSVENLRHQLDRELKLKLADDTPAKLHDFAAHYPYASPAADAIVHLTVASNTLAGQPVHLSFDASPVQPLVKGGSLLLTLRISDTGARIEALGHPADEVPFPDGVTQDNIQTALTATGQDFVDAMQDFGFIPPPGADAADLARGVLQIVKLGDKLLTHDRPYIIQVAAAHDLTNAEWPYDVKINVFKEPGS
jgi:hypothetical protein